MSSALDLHQLCADLWMRFQCWPNAGSWLLQQHSQPSGKATLKLLAAPLCYAKQTVTEHISHWVLIHHPSVDVQDIVQQLNSSFSLLVGKWVWLVNWNRYKERRNIKKTKYHVWGFFFFYFFLTSFLLFFLFLYLLSFSLDLSSAENDCC